MMYRIGEIMSSFLYDERVAKKKDICAKLGISPQRLSQIINSVGSKKATGEQLEVIASTIGVEVKDLIR